MLRQLSRAEAIIFDMDGVLFLSSGCHEQAFREVLTAAGVNDFSYASIAGMRTDEAFKKIFRDAGRQLSGSDEARLVKLKQSRVRELFKKRGSIADGTQESLDKLGQKFRLALASSASRGTVDIFLEKLSRPNIFEICLDGSAVFEAKPSPALYLATANKLNTTAEKCVVVEDSFSGVRSGVTAGMTVIAITGTETSETLEAAGAHHIVARLNDIVNLMKEK